MTSDSSALKHSVDKFVGRGTSPNSFPRVPVIGMVFKTTDGLDMGVTEGVEIWLLNESGNEEV